jgi:hypothetical protein
MEQFYTIASEANGNVTLCHRLSGAVVLYAHDHNFEFVETYPGCPDYTFIGYRKRHASGSTRFKGMVPMG